MRWSALPFVAMLMAAPALSQPLQGAQASDASMRMFQQDWLLMDWALRHFDADKNVLLSPEEAARAALAFKQIADGDADGRVTRDEYRRGREFILARY